MGRCRVCDMKYMNCDCAPEAEELYDAQEHIEELETENRKLWRVAVAARQVLIHDLYGHNERKLREALDALEEE